MKDNTNLKKSSPRPADPVIVSPKAEQPSGEAAQLRLSAFPDGNIFKWTTHPKAAGQFILFDVSNMPVAFVNNPAIADLLCNSVRMLFAAVAERKAQETLTDEQKAKNNADYKARAIDITTGGTGGAAPDVEGA